MKQLFVMRHGETDWNKVGRLQGQLDIPLNDQGHIQARTAASRLKSRPITAIWSSPLSRALETAKPLANLLGLSIIEDERLMERHFGIYQGMDRGDVMWDRKQRLIANPHIAREIDGHACPPEAEPMAAMFHRSLAVLSDAIAQEGTLLLVTHGLPFRAMTQQLLGQTYSSPNATPVQFFQDPDQTWHMLALEQGRPPNPDPRYRSFGPNA